jgi:DUF4097 and DUF4098 domain-containing protein YvlB
MKTIETRLQILGAILAALLLSILCATAAQEDVIQKTFTLSDKGTLAIDADRGSIDVVPSTDGQISIIIHRRAKALTEGKEREMLESHKVEFAQDGNHVRVTAKAPPEFFNWFRNSQLNVRFEVRLPISADAELKTAGGDIKVAELTGRLEAGTSGGSVRLGKVAEVKARTSGGDIQLETASANANLATSGGSIKAGRIEGTIVAHTSGGDVKIGSVAGAADLHTSGGSIHVEKAENTLKAETSGGNVEVATVVGQSKLRTSGGSIRVGHAGDSIQASTSGGDVRVALSSTLAEDCELRTAGGSIHVEVATGAAFDLDAKTSGGSAHCAAPITVVEKSKSSDLLRGKVNGGGKVLKLRTSGGDIRVNNVSA